MSFYVAVLAVLLIQAHAQPGSLKHLFCQTTSLYLYLLQSLMLW